MAVPDEDEVAAGSRPGRRRRCRGRGRTPRPGRAGSRGRARRPRARPWARAASRKARASGSSTSAVHAPLTAASGREDLEVEAAERREVVVSYQAHVRPLGHEGAAAVRARAVADEVAQAPDLVGRVPVDRREHRFEGLEVSVDVRDDGDAHGRRTLAKALGLVALAARSGSARPPSSGAPRFPTSRSRTSTPRDFFSAAELERIEDYRSVSRLLLLLARSRPRSPCSRCSCGRRGRSRRALERVGRGRVRTSVLVGLVVVAAVWLAGFRSRRRRSSADGTSDSPSRAGAAGSSTS